MSLRLPPLEVLATFPTPNYKDPITHGVSLTVVNSIFLVFATAALAGRLVSRGLVKERLGLDDLLICFAYIFTVGIHAVLNLGVDRLGWDRHIWDVRLDWVEGSLKNVYAGEILFFVASEFTVLSLMAFYYRIGNNAIPWFTWVLHTALFINLCSFTPLFLMALFQCHPLSMFWTWPPPANAHCVNPKLIVFGSGVVKVFIDIMITTIPIPLVLTLRLSPQQKRAVVVLLGVGYIVTAAGAIRTYYAYYILWRTYDETWYNYYGFLAATIENDLAIVCACAPALRPLVARMTSGLGTLQSYLSSRRGTRGTSEFKSQKPKKSVTQSGGTTWSEGTQSEPATSARRAGNFRGYTFWMTTMDNESEEFTEEELRGQSSQAGLARVADVERGVQRPDLNPAEPPGVTIAQRETPTPTREMREPNFRTWHIENNPFRGANNLYFPNQHIYGGRE